MGVEVAEVPAQRVAPVDRWALALTAAEAFRELEGASDRAAQGLETVVVGGEGHAVKLGVALANARQRRATWSVERLEA